MSASEKMIYKFLQNSLNNLGYFGLVHKGNQLVCRRDKDGNDTWTNNGVEITPAAANVIIERRFK